MQGEHLAVLYSARVVVQSSVIDSQYVQSICGKHCIRVETVALFGIKHLFCL